MKKNPKKVERNLFLPAKYRHRQEQIKEEITEEAKGKAMPEKTIVLRKQGHWYVLNSRTGDEREIILALMEYADRRKYDISHSDVYNLMDKLGWKLEVYIPGLGAA